MASSSASQPPSCSIQRVKASALENYLATRFDEYLKIFRKMVEVNSFSSNVAGVNLLADYTTEACRSLGLFDARYPDSARVRGDHLLLASATREEAVGKPSILFVSHLDTVFPEAEERANDFRWREVGDRIYGPGTCDIKGGTIVAMMVLDAIKEICSDVFAAARWGLALDACEETSSAGFAECCCDFIDSGTKAILVMEMGGCQGDTEKIATSRKGRIIYTIDVSGRAGHAGNDHHLGANAIVQAAHLIEKIASFTDYSKAITFNVGMVRGGEAVNRVPHAASLHGEMRAFAEDVFVDGVAKLQALADDIVVRSHDGAFACKVNVKLASPCAPWPTNDDTESLLRIWQDVAGKLGIKLIGEARGGLSDANRLWDLAPTLDGLGPIGFNDHCSEASDDGSKDQEYALKSSILSRAVLNACSVIRVLGGEVEF